MSKKEETIDEAVSVLSEYAPGHDILIADLAGLAARESRRDAVNHPSHYNAGGVECIDALESLAEGYDSTVLGALATHAVKYVWRAPLKGKTLEDLRKARWYLDRMIARLEA